MSVSAPSLRIRPRRAKIWWARQAFKFRHRIRASSWFSPAPAIAFTIVREAFHPFRYFTLYDREMIHELHTFLALTRGKSCFVDVGAHYGLFSLSFAAQNPRGKAFALEPSPTAFAVLERHRSANPELSVDALQLALDATAGTLAMRPGPEDHLLPGSRHGEPHVEIAATTLDDLVATKNITPDVIKIDTEGHELSILTGARETFARFRPLLFLEIHPQALRRQNQRHEEVLAWLQDRDYRFGRFGASGDSGRDPVDELESFRIVACHASTADTLSDVCA